MPEKNPIDAGIHTASKTVRENVRRQKVADELEKTKEAVRRHYRLRTKVFDICDVRYHSLSELAQAMGISVSQIYRVRQAKRSINEKFILGAFKAFPGYKLDDLFYVTEGSSNDRRLQE